jgi:hypothetical protein
MMPHSPSSCGAIVDRCFVWPFPFSARSSRRKPKTSPRTRTINCRTSGAGELPEVYQSALRLHYWLGASVSEIAVMLDAPENTVKSYLHRARRLLHAMLDERGFDARVMRRVRPRRLTPMGRVAIAVYIVVAAA